MRSDFHLRKGRLEKEIRINNFKKRKIIHVQKSKNIKSMVGPKQLADSRGEK